MTRAMVIGNAGGGKSTMCRAISIAHNLPCFAIDDILWKPNWVKASNTEFEDVHMSLVSKERWLIDGYGPMASVEQRLDACDTVIFVDLPIWVHFWWATKRQFKSLVFGRPVGPNNNKMWHVTFRLFKMMWSLHWDARPRLIEAIYSRSDSLRIIHITSPSDLNSFAAHPV